MSSATANPPKMTKTEMTELRRIVKARFELIHQGLNNRVYEVRQVIEDEIKAEHSAKMKSAQKQIDKFNERLRKMLDDAETLKGDLSAQGLDVTVPIASNKTDRSYVRYGVEEVGDLNVKDLYVMVEERMKKYTGDLNQIRLNLQQQELDILENLALGTLGENAKEFLGKIPTIETVLPMPDSAKELDS